MQPTKIITPNTEITSKNYFKYPAVNQSGLNTYLKDANLFWKQSPLNPKYIHIEKNSPALIEGKIAHCLLLEPQNFDNDFIILPDDLNRRTNEGKARYAALLAEAELKDAVLISQEQYDVAKDRIDRVNRNLAASKTLSLGEPEKPISWIDNFERGIMDDNQLEPTSLLCKAKIDQYRDGLTIDYKTSLHCSPNEFMREIPKYGYHRQAAWYQMGIEAATGETPRGHIWIVQSKENPDTIITYSLDAEDLAIARSECLMLLDSLKRRIDADYWETYSSQKIHHIKLSEWYKSFTIDDIF